MILEAGTPVDGGTPEPAAKDWRDAIRNAQTFGDIAAVFEAEFPADYAKYDYAENGVKAKKFKEWFGDWEKAALLGNMRYARGSDQAKAAAKEFIGVPLVNIDTGVTATVSGESLLKMLSKSAYERSVSVQAHMQAIANLDRLFQASAFRMSRDDRKGNENIKEIHHFDVPMKFDGEVLCVKIMAKEYTRKERGTRLYLVQAVEIGKPASCGEGLTSTQEMSSPVAAPPAGYGEKIAHLIDIVNGKITSKVVNPDGSPQETHEIQTPVPVYHGTAKAGFKEFDISKQDKTSLYGPGFYFTENKDVAREYMGKEVVEWATIKEDFRDTFLKVFNMDVMDLGAGALSSDDNQQLFLSDGAVEHLVRDARGFLNSERIKIAMPLVAGKTEANRAVYSCFLNIRNPFDADRDALDMQLLSRNEWMLLFPALVKFSDIEIDDFISKEIKRTTPGGYNYSLLEQQADSKAVANQVLQNVGYDGITHIGGNIMGGGKEHRVWIAFNPNQIKAVENQGTFDSSSGSILESAVQPNQKPTIAQDQSRKAMKFTLDTQKNTMQGASRPDIGWIAFLWGNPGTAPLFADGDGLARIIAKQDFEKKYLPREQSGRELCMRLVDMLTRGHIKRKYGPTSRPKVDLSWQGEIATVSWDPDRKTWYLAAWREDWGGILESAAPVTETASIDVDGLRVAVTIDNDYAASNNVPDGWIVFNATRPLAGDIVWEGDNTRGRHYAAVDPGGDDAEWMVKDNKSLDGWIYQDISAATMTAMVRQNYTDRFSHWDAGKVDAGMAKLNVSQIRGQFHNILEKMNYGAFKSLLAKSVQPEAKGTIKRFQSFEEFEKKYRWTFLEGGKYSPKQAGFNIYADELAKLSDAYPEWAEQAEQKWEDEHYSKLTVKEASTEQWRIDIRNAKTFQDIADVFKREFGVTVEDDPVMEAAVLEGWEDDLVSGGTSGDMKFKGGDWKDKLQAATTFDDIYLAFKASGIMPDNMPNKPQDAAILFDYADKIGKLIADFYEAENSTERIGNLETKTLLVTEIRNRGYGFNSVFPLLSEDQKYQYRNIPPLVTLQAAAGKEIFEAAKIKGASIFEAWQAGPDYERNRKHAADVQAAILLVESGHKELSDRYHASTKAIEDRYGFEQIHNDYAGEMVVLEKERNRLENNLSSLAAFTPEWVLAKAQLEDARAACAAVVVKHGKMYDDICIKIYDSEEYRSIGKEYEIHSELYSKQKKRLKADAEDLESLLYGGLTQEILETSPITIEQSNQWANEQMIDKSALATLKKQGYLETEIRKDMAELFRLSGGRFGKCYLQPRFKGQSRACAETNQKIIHIGAEFTKRTLWHEMGHLFESDAKYTHVSQSFLDGRVDKAKGLLPLSELTGNKNYRKDEVAFTDHLFDAYVGKYYGPDTSTEVMSMGVQQFSSPELMSELYKSDPEMFHVIIGILATPPSDSEKEKFIGDLKLAKAITDASKPIDVFYKMLDKKIKQNPDFYKPFARFESVSGHKKTSNSNGYYIISNGFDSYGHYIFQFSAKSKQIVLQIAYLYLALEQSTQGDGATRDFKDWGQFNVINKDSIPAAIANVPSWVTDGLPDIKAA